jgi:SAM-dependent methyltransferase
MSTTLDFDADRAAQIERIYATPDVVATRSAVFRAAAPRIGEQAVDLGCGPGYLTRDLALAVGPAGRVSGIDNSDPMLELARRHCAGLAQVRLDHADALDLPFADQSTDLACILQVYAYVRALDDALIELRRVLKPDGRAVILDSDMRGIVWESRERSRMDRILTAWDQHVAWPDLPRILPSRLHAAGLKLVRCEALPFITLTYHENTFVHGMARLIHQFVTTSAGVSRDEADAWLSEFDVLERDHGFFFAMNRFMFVVQPGGAVARQA